MLNNANADNTGPTLTGSGQINTEYLAEIQHQSK